MKTNKLGQLVFSADDSGYVLPLGEFTMPWPTVGKALTKAELRYALDATEVRPELYPLAAALKEIDGAMIYGVPLREMTKTELMAACVFLFEHGNIPRYRTEAT